MQVSYGTAATRPTQTLEKNTVKCSKNRNLLANFFSSLSSLYFETGWETLADRRKCKKLYLMINNDSPSYSVDLLPYRVQEISNYNLGSRENYLFRVYVHMKLHSIQTRIRHNCSTLSGASENETRHNLHSIQFKENYSTSS